MPRLILHSDDFGLHPRINQAVWDAAKQGTLTSASLMVNGLARNEAIALAKALPHLGIGVHLNIVRGKPLSRPSEIPSLVNKKGRFLNSVSQLLMRSVAGSLSVKEIYGEYRHQVRYLLDRGIQPTHLDGEKHTHLLIPEAAHAVKLLSDEFKIKKVRRINESPIKKMLLRSSGIRIKGSLRQRLKLALLEFRSKQVLHSWKSMKMPDFSFGLLLTGQTHSSDMPRILQSLLELPQKEIIIEWFFHPGYPFNVREAKFYQEFGSFFLDQSRKKELDNLLSKQVVRLIQTHPDQFISYRDV